MQCIYCGNNIENEEIAYRSRTSMANYMEDDLDYENLYEISSVCSHCGTHSHGMIGEQEISLDEYLYEDTEYEEF